MATDAGLLGVAIVLTILVGAALSAYESLAPERGWRRRNLGRPGATALLIGVTLAATFTGRLLDNLFVIPAAAFAAVSGMDLMRRNGRLTSFLLLWLGAVPVVMLLHAEVPAFGVLWGDTVFSALLLGCFASLVRELDADSSAGWFLALATAIAATALAYGLGHDDDAGTALLVTGAVFAVISVSPFGAGLLGRVGSRLSGMVVGALAIRAASGSPLAMAALVGVALLCALAFVVLIERANRGRVLLGALVVGGLMVGASVPAVLALLDVAGPIRSAVVTSRGLVGVTAQDDLATTTAQLKSVEQQFRASADKLNSPLVLLGQYVPFLGVNLRAARQSALVASSLSSSASALLADVNVKSVGVRDATVAKEDLDRLARGLRIVNADVQAGLRAVDDDRARDLLVPELREGVADLATQVQSVAQRVDTSLAGTDAATRLLGFDTPKRYFVAVQNNAESRATGGYIANYGILVADGGRITLPEFRRTSEFDATRAQRRTLTAPLEYKQRYSRFDVSREWTNVNLAPDFPTVARVMADQYRQFSGTTVDGVIAIDPIALARLLRLTGPVRVAGWPVPINADNLVAITLHDEYTAFDKRIDDRIDFIGDVAKVVFDKLTTAGLADLVRAGNAIDDATSTRHLQVWARDRVAQSFFHTVDADGAVEQRRGDGLLVTTQNVAGNKTDYFLRRFLDYDATVTRVSGGYRVDATLRVALQNNAPTTGEPRYVIGPFDSRFKAGENRSFVTVYSPLEAVSATLDGEALEVSSSPESGFVARSAVVSIPAGATRVVEMRLRGVIASDDLYGLTIFRQPVVTDDTVRVALRGVGPGGRYEQNAPLTSNFHLELSQ